jgi:hypothetical protein
MNTNAVAKNYCSLTPEERFRLILAASGRGDATERERLVNASGRITLTMTDHAPFVFAFRSLELLMFIGLSDQAARYHEAIEKAINARLTDGADAPDLEASAEGEPNGTEEEPTAGTSHDDANEQPAWLRFLDRASVIGFALHTEAEGWKLFCERMNVPAFRLWEGLPGFNRLKRAFAEAEQVSFTPEELVLWHNECRPECKPEITVESLLSPTKLADGLEEWFRERVAWWGG